MLLSIKKQCVKHYENETNDFIIMSILKVGENLVDNNRPFQVKNVVVITHVIY